MNLSGFKKYETYYINTIKMNIMSLIEYRTDFTTVILGTYGYMLLALFFLNILFKNINSLGGWTYYQIMILFSITQFLYYIFWSFTGGAAGFLTNLINRGELDKFLIKPINTVFSICTNQFALFTTLPSFLFAFVIFYTGVKNVSIEGSYILFIISLIISSVILYLNYFTISIITFWWEDTGQMHSVFNNLLDLQNYPLEIYPKLIKPLFVTLIPIAIIAYAPFYFLLRGFSLELFAYQITALTTFLIIAILLWKNGLKNYSSASS
ncbi:hypothetical protein COV24_04365 [candidate division WWE3 bacterium CG10_big_fil_rev_8_21_14_0_10_32_10]|uniref:ABC transporter permease n=1 Tax=candidate division WWE3 bacterium CG10_big_fil_rev_8_21_14_0_10_32_10 TaxID=1975090 RepID=A0A2H0R9H1_UNCKA|nr:MAG: hypothetical protein COV24_04365 [candidate division WWE3 bacterium CG10_big_fil_rev_8_21_14_0_10_32_10]